MIAPGLAALMEYVRAGDTVVVCRLDRLGRNTLHILATVKALTDRGVTLVFGTGVEGRSRWSRRDSRQVLVNRMLKNPILVPPSSNGDVLALGDNHERF